ncbi:MAG: four helix bundle protein [Candidatus Omnitrophica bacterium]|nr:four helix bundle protein [Candidatus Omnitrophota bacterium]
MKEKIKDFKDLKVWQKAMEIVTNTYNMVKKFPQEELYALSSQMKRAVVSIPSNIAEGFQRKHPKEYIQFLNVASASSAELETQILIAKNLNYINEEQSDSLISEIRSLCKMISSLAKKIYSENLETRYQRLETNT